MNYCNRCAHYVVKSAPKCALEDPNFGALCGQYDYDFQRFRPDQPTTEGTELSSNLWQRAAEAFRNLANGK